MDPARFLRATLQKLSGNLVATPLIGDLRLPGRQVPPGLRLKAENLQTGGGIWFRGAMHELAQRYGAPKGIVVSGPPRVAFAGACAAAMQRFPVIAVVAAGTPDVDYAPLFEVLECELREAADDAAAVALAAELAGHHGFLVLPGLGSPAYADGVATVGLELARDMPFDTARVFVSPAALAEPIERGLRAAGRDGCRVIGVDRGADTAELVALARGVQLGARLVADLGSVAALARALDGDAGPNPCVVLSS